MKKLTLVTGLSALALSSVLTPQDVLANEVESHTYTVKTGDNLYRIAQKSGLSVDELKKMNHLTDNVIFVGQTLNVATPTDTQNQELQVQEAQDKTPEVQAPQVQSPTTYKPTTTIPSGHTVNFSKAMAEAAQKAPSKGKLFTSVLIAQAILESGSGSSGLAKNYNNYFGVKGAYQGQSVSLQTQEYVNDGLITINDNFKVYPSPTESIEDYYALFFQSDWSKTHYSEFINAKTYTEAAHALTGKYATDIHYGEKLINLIKVYQLQQYDGESSVVSDQAVGHYKIKAGDTLSSIAYAQGTTYDQLATLNTITSPYDIFAGNTLKVPTKVNESTKKTVKKTTSQKTTKVYTIKAGDTLTKIASEHGSTWSELQDINQLASPNQLSIGQTIYLQK